MRLFHVVCALVVTTVLSSNNAVSASVATVSEQVQVSKLAASDGAPWSEVLATGRNDNTEKRLLQTAETPNQVTCTNSPGSLNETQASETNSSVPSASKFDEEERTIKLPSTLTKLVEKKIPIVIKNLLTGDKHQKSQAKLRALLLRSLPPEKASNLIFLKMPSKVPKPLPSKLPKGIKGYDFKIPGVSNAIIRLKMEIWFYYRYPPTYAFEQLGLVGKGSGDKLHVQENYKYFKSYFDAWYESQKHLIF